MCLMRYWPFSTTKSAPSRPTPAGRSFSMSPPPMRLWPTCNSPIISTSRSLRSSRRWTNSSSGSSRAHRPPIEAVHVRVVEELLLHAPGLVEDLMPLLTRIDQHPETAEIHRLRLELLVGVGHLHLAFGLGQQQLLAVGARRYIDQMGLEHLLGAILEAVAIE